MVRGQALEKYRVRLGSNCAIDQNLQHPGSTGMPFKNDGQVPFSRTQPSPFNRPDSENERRSSTTKYLRGAHLVERSSSCQLSYLLGCRTLISKFASLARQSDPRVVCIVLQCTTIEVLPVNGGTNGSPAGLGNWNRRRNLYSQGVRRRVPARLWL